MDDPHSALRKALGAVNATVPASPAEIAKIEEEYGGPLPAAIRAFYELTDGAIGYNGRIYSCGDLVIELFQSPCLLEDADWRAEYFPFGQNWASEYFFFRRDDCSFWRIPMISMDVEERVPAGGNIAEFLGLLVSSE